MARAALPKIAVLLPCFNEEAAIAATVTGFRGALPDAIIYVYDNNSGDGTCEAARKAGRSSVLLLVKRGNSPEAFVPVGIGGK